MPSSASQSTDSTLRERTKDAKAGDCVSSWEYETEEMATLRAANAALQLKHPRYSRRVQSKSEPTAWESEAGSSNKENNDPDDTKAPASGQRRVSAPLAQQGSGCNIPRRKGKAFQAPSLHDIPSEPSPGAADDSRPNRKEEKTSLPAQPHKAADADKSHFTGARGRGGKRGRGIFRGRKIRGGLRASSNASETRDREG